MGQTFLIAAKDYWGTTMAVHTANMYNTLANSMNADARLLIGNDLTVAGFLSEYKRALEVLKEPDSRAIIVTIGHGNQFADQNGDEEDGKDEGWQLPDGTILDDTLTGLVTCCHPSSMLVLISDHCSSGTMLDRSCIGNWANIASSQSWQDSLASGDGNVMSCCLLDYLKDTNPTMEELASGLTQHMASSWVGELQTPCISMGGNAAKMNLFTK